MKPGRRHSPEARRRIAEGDPRGNGCAGSAPENFGGNQKGHGHAPRTAPAT